MGKLSFEVKVWQKQHNFSLTGISFAKRGDLRLPNVDEIVGLGALLLPILRLFSLFLGLGSKDKGNYFNFFYIFNRLLSHLQS